MGTLQASLIAVIAATAVPAQQPGSSPPLVALLPNAPPPLVCFAKAQLKDGAVELRVVQPQLVPEQRERIVERNGKKLTEKYFIHVAVQVERLLRVDNKAVRVMTRAGKNVDPQTLLRTLAKDTPVLLSFDGPVEPFYLAVVRDDVLIVVQEKANVNSK